MNNKIVSIKKTSAIFLAIVLVTGTIALTGPTFIVKEAQATSDRDKHYDNDDDNDKSYEKDDRRDKSNKDSKSVNIKKIKCNNINVNLNGVDADIELPFNDGLLNGAIAKAQAAEDEGTNSFEKSGSKNNDKKGQSDSDIGFKFVCINNNNNIVVGEEPEPLTCEDCFEEVLNSNQFATLQAALAEGVIVDIEGEIIEVDSLEEYCNLLEAAGNIAPGNLVGAVESLIANAGVTSDLETFAEVVDALFSCLVEALDIELPPSI